MQEILKLHQKSMALNARNDQLSRSIAEKENHISAFMYESNQPTSSVQHQDNYSPMVGVTLVDQPLSTAVSPPTPPLPPKNTNGNDNISPTESAASATPAEVPAKKETGIFRQISLRLSSRKRRQNQQQPQQEESQQHQSSSLQISEPITDAVSSSSSDSILHPAVVISSPHSSNRLHQQATNDDSGTSFKRKKSE